MHGVLEARPEAIAAALRTTTEMLARELAHPGRTAPAWTELEWRMAEAASALHGVSPLLHRILQWQGPARWHRFLAGQHDHTLARHRRINGLLRNVDASARREGVAIIALKGAALHDLGVYRAGERPMADVDLLVRESDHTVATRVLEQVDYEPGDSNWKHAVFVPRDASAVGRFGEHAANPVKIDLHVRIREFLPVEVDITERVLGPRPEPGLNGYPTHAGLLSHLLLHAAGNMRNRCLRMIQVHDIARVAARLDADDWAAVIRTPSPWWALPPLQLASRYYPLAVPPGVLAGLARDCPRRLRRACRRQALTDVSFSNFWIEAFPGLEWSRPGMDSLRYVASRVWPRRHELVARDAAVQSVQWMAESPWNRLPHWQRVLRWAWSRPPRVETMNSVTTALRGVPVEVRAGSTT
jgi:hypothetical protein